MNEHNNDDMNVVKRNGQKETVSFDKILERIKKVGLEANIKINYTSLVMKVIDQLYDGISTSKIDELTAEQCASLSSTHTDYNALAGRITVSNHHKNTKSSFFQVMNELYSYKDQHGLTYPLISEKLYKDILFHGKEKVDSLCDYSRDYLIDYFGFKTLERSYLMQISKRIVERPQHMWLRVSMGIHGRDWARVTETYACMSQKYFTHATPTLFNAGTPHPQLSSCYLMAIEDDSIDGIFNTLKDCALISK
jgi:ribonucleoside-diphosphate reductase alpha chain